MNQYVHGYSEREKERLYDQAMTVRELIHHDTRYPDGCLVLEAGCGVGAQTVSLAQNSPGADILSVDRNAESLETARTLAQRRHLINVRFEQADIFDLPYPDNSFDHVFVCFVLEHLADPTGALASLRRVLKPNGTLTVFEGDHGSCYFHPETDASLAAWRCLIRVQAGLGGNSLIGRALYPVLERAGLKNITVSPRMVYMDWSRPALMDGFVRKTIIPMVAGVETQALAEGMIDEITWRRGLQDLHDLADSRDGSFCYTFFKATSVK